MALDKSYNAQHGQSIYDLALLLYGSVDFVYKLIQDNAIHSIDSISFGGTKILFDSSLVTDKSVFDRNDTDEIFYVTGIFNPPAGGLMTDDAEPIMTDDGEYIIISG
jgi:hypothetical protein